MLVSTATFKELTEALLSGGFIRNPTSGLILHVSPDDIPTEGILCWVFDQDSKTQSRVEMLK